MARPIPPYPLLFEPILLEKVWGGRRLETLGKNLPSGKLIGESWELADLDSTTVSGGGGGAARSRIANGPLTGKTIHEALELWGDRLLNTVALTAQGRIPLLIKFLDARENLSVQVHPSPAYAAAHSEAHLKTECWYILDAEPGSVIYKGVKSGVSPEEFARLARAGDRAIVEALVQVPARRGECHNLPSGTVHALGAGVLVAEVQTPSDTTFRLYDWGRVGREMHIEQALECADFSPPPRAVRLEADAAVSTDWFTLRHERINHDGVPAAERAGRAFIVLEGEVELAGPDLPGGDWGGGGGGGGGTRMPARRGSTGFIPERTMPGVLLRSAGRGEAGVLFVSVSVPLSRLMGQPRN